jgi:hypothetical protein
VIEVVFFDDPVRPNGCEKLILAQEFAGILDENGQALEDFSTQADLGAIAKKPMLIDIQEKFFERIAPHNFSNWRLP